MSLAFLALGSNIDAEKNLRAAAAMLRSRFPSIRFSQVYRTAPVGYAAQEDFLNAAAMIETDEEPEQIHQILESIETSLGKAAPFRNGPRTIDLDLLLWDDKLLHEPRLTLPHPRMQKRRFVLEPLCELIEPTSEHPVLKIFWKDLLEGTMEQRTEKVELVL